jgi:hypothetical protein
VDLGSNPDACGYSLAQTLGYKCNQDYVDKRSAGVDGYTPSEDASAAGNSITGRRWMRACSYGLARADGRSACADCYVAGANASTTGDNVTWRATALTSGIVNVFKKMERGEEFKKFNRL